jgi:hypothetical protein
MDAERVQIMEASCKELWDESYALFVRGLNQIFFSS